MTRAQTAQLKKRFLEHFARLGNVSVAATEAGIERRQVYHWKERDPKFAESFADAEQQAIDVLEAEAYRRAHDGVSRLKFGASGHVIIDPETGKPYRELDYSDTLLIFLLKSRNPRKYAQRMELTGADGAPLTFSEGDLRERIRQEVERAAERAGTTPA